MGPRRRTTGLAEEGLDARSYVQATVELVSSGEPPELVVITVARQLCELLWLQDCRFERTPFSSDEVLTWRLQPDGDLVVGENIIWRRPSRLPGKQVELLVTRGDRCFGRYVLAPTAHDVSHNHRVFAVVLVEQVAAAFAVLASLTGSQPTGGSWPT
jgi:hypothetical protein